MLVSVTFTENIDHMPETCSKCHFADVCDGRVAKLTKNGGMEWTKTAVERVSRHCPMKIEEN